MQIAQLAIQAVAALANAAIIPAVIALVFIAIICWWMHSARSRLALVARLLSVAAGGLKRNKHLVTLSLGLNTLAVGLAVPMLVGLRGAVANGVLPHIRRSCSLQSMAVGGHEHRRLICGHLDRVGSVLINQSLDTLHIRYILVKPWHAHRRANAQ